METQIMTDDCGNKKTIFKFFIPISGIHSKTKAQVYKEIVDKIDEAKDSNYILLNISFEDDHMIMSIQLKDIENQKNIIKSMIDKIASNGVDKRISIPGTGEETDMRIHILYHRYFGSYIVSKNMEERKNDSQAV